MTQHHTTRSTTLGSALRARREARAARAQLAHDLAAFRTKSDLADLAAILDRYTDAQAADVRNIVDWSRAA